MQQGARCSFCLRDRSQVAKLFTGYAAYACDRCIATMVAKLNEEEIELVPNIYCVACGFEIREDPSVSMIKGRVCRSCAGEIAEHARQA